MAKQEQYIYAVTRIRYRELQLLRDADMEQLLACRDLDAALRYLAERGWTSEGGTVEDLLEAQKRQLWSLLRELVKRPARVRRIHLPQRLSQPESG